MLFTGSAIFPTLNTFVNVRPLCLHIYSIFRIVQDKYHGTLSGISIITITDLLLTNSGRNLDEPGVAYSYLNKIDDTFIKPIIVGGIIGYTFITMVGDHLMLLHTQNCNWFRDIQMIV